MSTTPLRGNPFAPLRKSRNYRLFLGGQGLSTMGNFMQDTALPWLMLELTGSPKIVGLLVFCRYFPYLLLGLFSGTLADRFDNRRLLLCTQTGQFLVAASIATLAFTVSVPWPFFVLALTGGTLTALEGPSRQAFVIRLVGRDDLQRAIALNSSVTSSGIVLGPAVGGVLIAVVGVGMCSAINACACLVMITCLTLMRVSELYPIDRHVHEGTIAAIREGLRYARGHRQIRLVLAIVAFTSLAGFNFRVILPVLAEKTLDADATTFGLMFAAFGVGSIAGGLVIASAGGRASWRNVVASSLCFNVAVLLIAPVNSVYTAIGAVFFVGGSFTGWMSSTQSLLQLEAPDRMRGRIVSMFFFCWAGVAPFSALMAGWLCHVGGTRLAVLVSGTAGLTTLGLVLLRARRVPFDVGARAAGVASASIPSPELEPVPSTTTMMRT